MSSHCWAGITRTRWATPLLCVALGFAAGILCSSVSTKKDARLLPGSNTNAHIAKRAIFEARQASGQPNNTWPVTRLLHCGDGTWQREYAQLHRGILAGTAEPRYLLAHGQNGLADSLVGAVTLFWVAVLQRRAFAMKFGAFGAYEWAFDQPHINWTWSDNYIDHSSKYRFHMTSRRSNEWQSKTIREGDIRSIGPNYTTLIVTSYKGYVNPLLNNKHHKADLLRMGLHPSNMFACAVDFLLRVKPTAMAALGGQYARLADPAPLKIGIHIRVGDQQLVAGGGRVNISQFEAWFDCAAQIEAARRTSPAQAVRWFLATDSLALRQQAQAAHGSKLVTSLELPLAHTRQVHTHAAKVAGIAEAEPSTRKPAFQAAAAEMWLLSLCDYHVFTTHSGYGRLGAFMSGRYHQAYGIDFWKDSVDVPPKQRCGPKDYIKSWNV